MKLKWRLMIVCIVFLAAVMYFTAKVFNEDDKPKVIVVSKSLEAEYWRMFESGAEKAFEDFHIDGKVIAPPSGNASVNQVNMVQNVLVQQPDALIVAPIEPSAIVPVLTEYNKNNIPVVLADTDAGWKDTTSFIGTDNLKLGEIAGALLASMLQPGDQVALISGPLPDPVVSERIKGAKQALEDAGINIVTEQQGYDKFWNVKPVMGPVLLAYPDIQGVITTDDTPALEALKVIEEKGLKIPVVGADGVMKMMKHIETGTLRATVAQNPYDMGYRSVEQTLKAIKGETVEKRVDSGVDIITEDNVKSRLDFLKQALHLKEGVFSMF
jgi:ribose transport system substrate-binding protein